jgi:hypothetical protein
MVEYKLSDNMDAPLGGKRRTQGYPGAMRINPMEVKGSMKPRAFLSIFMFPLLFIGCASTKSYVRNPQRLNAIKRVAVLPFICRSRDIGYAISEGLAARMVASQYDIIERTQFEKLLNEQGLTLSGALEDQSSIVGKIKGVDAIIVGSATVDNGFAGIQYGGYIDYVSSATARMIDLITGEVLVAATFSSSGPSTFSGVTPPNEVGEKLAKKIISH